MVETMFRSSRDTGFSLVEMLVVLGMVAIFLGAMSAFTLTTLRSVGVVRTWGQLAADVATAERILYTDIGFAGYGIPPKLYGNYRPFEVIDNLGVNGSDILVLRAASFVSDPFPGKWSIVLKSSGDTLIVHRGRLPWRTGDTLVYVRGTSLASSVIQQVLSDSTVWVDPISARSYEVQILLIQPTATIAKGTPIYKSGSSLHTVAYLVDVHPEEGVRLIRREDGEGSTFLTGVRLFQVEIWVDRNENGRKDAGEIVYSTTGFGVEDYRQTRSLTVHLVVQRQRRTPRGAAGGATTISVANQSLTISPEDARRYVLDHIQFEVFLRNVGVST